MEQRLVRQLDELKPNPLNPRRGIKKDDAFHELVSSVKEWGILEPLLVTGDNLIVAGHRRYAAAQEAGLAQVPVTPCDLTPHDQLAVMLVENIQREGLSPLEEARAFATLRDTGLSTDELALKVGLSVTTIEIRFDLLTLPDVVQEYIDIGKIPIGTVREFKRLQTAQEQTAMANSAVAANWGTRDIKKAVQAQKQAKPRLSALEQYKLDRNHDLDWCIDILDRMAKRLEPHEVPTLQQKVKSVEQGFIALRKQIGELQNDIVDTMIEDGQESPRLVKMAVS